MVPIKSSCSPDNQGTRKKSRANQNQKAKQKQYPKSCQQLICHWHAFASISHEQPDKEAQKYQLSTRNRWDRKSKTLKEKWKKMRKIKIKSEKTWINWKGRMVKLLTTRKIKNMGIVCTILLAKQLGRRNGMPRATFCGDSLESDGSATWPTVSWTNQTVFVVQTDYTESERLWRFTRGVCYAASRSTRRKPRVQIMCEWAGPTCIHNRWA